MSLLNNKEIKAVRILGCLCGAYSCTEAFWATLSFEERIKKQNEWHACLTCLRDKEEYEDQ